MNTAEAEHRPDFLGIEDVSLAVREQLLVLDDQLRVQGGSQSFYTALQAAPAQVAATKLAEIGHGQWNIPALLTRLNELPKADGEFDNLEIELDFPPLGRRTMLFGARRLLGTGAQDGMILLSIRDATGRKRVEADARDALARCHAILATIGCAVIVTDPAGGVTFINPAAEKITGWRASDALQKDVSAVFKIVNERSSQPEESVIAKSIREREVGDLAKYTVLIARDGSEWPIDGNTAPFFDAAGRLAGAVLVFHDISNRRHAEQELEISEIRYRRLFESAHDGILILDAVTSKVVDVNPFMGDLLGYPREHFLGKELWEIGVFKDADMSKKAMATLQKVGRIRYEDLPLLHKDGRHIPVEFVSNVYREGRRNVIQCNIRDITERKRMSHDLAQATLDAQAASRSKSEFLANMSHEIRTPMGAILGFADMLLTKSPEECAKIGCVQIIRRNTLHLLELINEVLDISKVEAGQMQVERVSCDLPALLTQVISLLRPRAKEKGLDFGVTFQGPIPRMIQTDPLRLKQILVNLIGNAIKFTEAGRIDLKISDLGAGTPNIVLRVEVIDTGIGMTPEQMTRLFMPFTQGDGSITRKFGGTGLGLTISRQFARLLGGDVTASGQAGMGSAFTVTVDGGPSAGVELLEGLTETTLPTTDDRKKPDKIRLRGRILLVEDGADNQRLLAMQLGDAGGSVTVAGDGQVAVDLTTTLAFDVILMDMQMPVMDGYAATQELRGKGLKTPIIALTAYAMAQDRDKCMAIGCTDYLSKPTDEQTLLKTVRQYLEKDPAPEPVDRAKAGDSADTGLGPAPPSGDAAASGPIRSSQADNARIMEIVPEFVAGLPGKVRKMIDFLGGNDLQALQQIAHQLSGSCGGYGFDAVTEPARAVEKSIKEGRTLERVTMDVKSLIEVVRRIEGYDESKELVPAGKS